MGFLCDMALYKQGNPLRAKKRLGIIYSPKGALIEVEREKNGYKGDDRNDRVDAIAGRNAVLEAIKADKQIDIIYITTGETQGSINKIKALAMQKHIVVKAVTPQKLDELCSRATHQGVVATISCEEYASLEDILAVSKEKGREPFLIIADEIEDPHNLGAIIRTAEAAGADGLIIPKRRSASLSTTVHKTSAGAVSALLVARVPNLVSCIKELKKQNIWIYGADMDGTQFDKLDFKNGGVAIVIGSEGNGLNRLVKEECDFIATIPMKGKINSLNASVAAGILMYETVRQRSL